METSDDVDVCACVHVNTGPKPVTSGINNPGCSVSQFHVSSWLDSGGQFLLVKDHCGCGKVYTNYQPSAMTSLWEAEAGGLQFLLWGM